MRPTLLPLLLAASLLGGCASRQSLTSPCLKGELAANPQSCPACTTASDCYVLSNPCQAAASCVPRGSNWAVTQEGCSLEHEVPPAEDCGCIEGVCQALPDR